MEQVDEQVCVWGITLHPFVFKMQTSLQGKHTDLMWDLNAFLLPSAGMPALAIIAETKPAGLSFRPEVGRSPC